MTNAGYIKMVGISVVADHVEAAAFGRSFRAKGGNDDVPARFHRMRNPFHICLALVRQGQKVKYGTVVPYVVVLPWQRRLGDVRDQPRHVSG